MGNLLLLWWSAAQQLSQFAGYCNQKLRSIGHVAYHGSCTLQEKRILHEYVQRYSQEISQLLLSMPRDLLLLLKTNDCLRSLERRLSAPLNTVSITARACTRALSEFRQEGASSLSGSVLVWMELVAVELQLWLVAASMWWLRVRKGGMPT
jgi:aarF domain-containing kinase